MSETCTLLSDLQGRRVAVYAYMAELYDGARGVNRTRASSLPEMRSATEPTRAYGGPEWNRTIVFRMSA